jgi:N-acetylglucosaminyldiphosphoundecaprenol N-acetyl-beta-D-mannosaminyltransferase
MPAVPSTERAEILGSNISIWNLDETLMKLHELAASGGKHYVCVSNVHTVVMGLEDKSYAHVTNGATLATADGVPLVWASRLLGGPRIHGRASGPDIMLALLKRPEHAGLRHYFYGSTPNVLHALSARVKELAPNAIIAGAFSPPKREAAGVDEPLSPGELEECAHIDEARPDIVWVGLGAPKQELWMYRAREHLKAPVLIGIGAAFDFLAGNKARAPIWMQRSGLEWFYRLAQEPRRLASRYLKTNPVFVAAVAREWLRARR